MLYAHVENHFFLLNSKSAETSFRKEAKCIGHIRPFVNSVAHGHVYI